jgi:putative flavoprotein involved in K+ transport
VRFIEAYAASFGAPVQENTCVQRIARASDGRGFALETAHGRYQADQVVVATGGYHVPKTPAMARNLPPEIAQLHSSSYRNPQQLPQGAVMVVGSGQSGCQIAEDLHLAGREVHLCLGSAPRVARRYRGKDVVEWLERMGHYDVPIDRHPDRKAVRKKSNHYVTGRDGGRDIDLRKFACEGMHLHGRLTGITSTGFEFGDDLEQNLDRADATNERIKDSIDAFIAKEGICAPLEARKPPLWRPHNSARSLALADSRVRSVIWSLGFALDFRFIDLPAFDADGYPNHERGVSAVPGMYFLGLGWLYTWGSGRFAGIARDAMFVCDALVRSAAQAQPGEGWTTPPSRP